MRVLLVEDDDRLAAALCDVLRLHGMVVDQAASARQALEQLTARTDAVVLDLGLPDRDGFEVCSRIRRTHDVPILMATARSDLTSRVHGLNLGADDYLVKPYDVRELMARLHAVGRRRRRQPRTAALAEPSSPAAESATVGSRSGDGDGGVGKVVCGEITIDVERRSVDRLGVPIALTRKEFDVLALLSREPGVVFRREQIISEIWQSTWAGCQRTLEVHVAAVRAKTATGTLIETVRGVGYRLGPGRSPS
jgi:DNA-binding response OmpR family regulator